MEKVRIKKQTEKFQPLQLENQHAERHLGRVLLYGPPLWRPDEKNFLFEINGKVCVSERLSRPVESVFLWWGVKTT